MKKLATFLITTSAFMILFQYLMIKQDIDNFIGNVVLNGLPILCSFALCIYFKRKLKEDIKNKNFDSIYPTLMVAQGTFYTFVGVCSVLLVYSIAPDSIQVLLSGLKLAFISSVIGLFFSILAKIEIKNSFNIHQQEKNIHNIYYDENDIYNILSVIASNLIKSHSYQENICEKLSSISNKIDISNNLLTNKMDINNNLLDINNNLLKKQNKEIRDELKSSNEQSLLNLNKMLTSLDRTLQSHIESVFKNIEKNSKALNTNLLDARNSVLTITTTLNNVNKSINSNTKNMLENLNLITKQIKDFNMNVSSTIEETSSTVSTAITENSKLIAQSFKSLNNETNNLLIKYKEVYANLQLELRQITEFITPEKLNILNNISNDIQHINEAINNYKLIINKQQESLENVSERINIANNSIISTADDVSSKREEIIHEFKNLSEALIQQSNEFNNNFTKKTMDNLKNEQEKFVHELNDIVLSIVGVIGDLIKKVKEDNLSKINTINQEIIELKKRNE